MNEIRKSSEMPAPQVLDYWKLYEATPALLKDLNTVLGDVAYVDAAKFMNKLSENGNKLTSAAVNEFIRELSGLPYKHVKDIMPLLLKPETFKLYFKDITPEKK